MRESMNRAVGNQLNSQDFRDIEEAAAASIRRQVTQLETKERGERDQEEQESLELSEDQQPQADHRTAAFQRELDEFYDSIFKDLPMANLKINLGTDDIPRLVNK
jgi:monoamine oxidase